MCTMLVCVYLLVRACCCKLSNGVPSCWQWTGEREVSPFPCGHAAWSHAVRADPVRAAGLCSATCWCNISTEALFLWTKMHNWTQHILFCVFFNHIFMPRINYGHNKQKPRGLVKDSVLHTMVNNSFLDLLELFLGDECLPDDMTWTNSNSAQ